MSRIDYAHDSLAEILLAQRERIAALEEIVVRQADRMACLEIERIERLEREIPPRLIEEKERLEEAICALEYTLARRIEAGDTFTTISSVLCALGDVANYATSGVAPPWLRETIRQMDEEESAEW